MFFLVGLKATVHTPTDIEDTVFDMCPLIQRFKSFIVARVCCRTVQTDWRCYKSKGDWRVGSGVLQVAGRSG